MYLYVCVYILFILIVCILIVLGCNEKYFYMNTMKYSKKLWKPLVWSNSFSYRTRNWGAERWRIWPRSPSSLVAQRELEPGSSGCHLNGLSAVAMVSCLIKRLNQNTGPFCPWSRPPPHQTGGPSRAVQEPELGGQLPWGPASVWTASSSSSTSERTLRRRHGSTRHAAGGEGFRPPGGRGAQNRRRRECLERRPVLSRGGAQGEEGRRMLILWEKNWCGQQEGRSRMERQRGTETESGATDTLRIFRALGLVLSTLPPTPQLPLQESEQLTLAQRRKVTHREHKTSSGVASLPSSGAVWSPEAQTENTAGHIHKKTTGRPRGLRGPPPWPARGGGWRVVGKHCRSPAVWPEVWCVRSESRPVRSWVIETIYTIPAYYRRGNWGPEGVHGFAKATQCDEVVSTRLPALLSALPE